MFVPAELWDLASAPGKPMGLLSPGRALCPLQLCSVLLRSCFPPGGPGLLLRAELC